MFPLEGKRILSFETWGSGAFHAELLALMGAEVINIEDPQQRGNPLRRMGSLYLDEEGQDVEILESLGYAQDEIRELGEKQIIIC